MDSTQAFKHAKFAAGNPCHAYKMIEGPQYKDTFGWHEIISNIAEL